MSFITTGLRELTLKVRRQRTRMALRHEKRLLKKSEIALGREGTSEAVKFPEVRNEIVALKKLEQEQREFALRIAQIEEALKQLDQQRQENAQAQTAALSQLEEEKRPLVEQRDAARAVSDNCSKELSSYDRRLAANEAADAELLKKLSTLETAEPPPADLQEQKEQLAAQRAHLPEEKAQIVQGRLTSVDKCRDAREKLTLAEAALSQMEKRIARTREEFEARDRGLNESSRAHQEEIRAARQRHQTVEEKKNPAYLNIGRHLANAGIAPPNAPQLLEEVRRRRATVSRLEEHTHDLAEISSKIDKQELRRFYFTVASLLVLLAIVVPLAMQSPVARDWLPQDTVAILSFSPVSLAASKLGQGWQKEQPGVWSRILRGLAGAGARTPTIDLTRDVNRITRAITWDDRSREHDYVLVQTAAELTPVLRSLSQDGSYAKETFNGLVVWQKPDLAVARVGPKTIAIGSLSEVDRLVEVRLGLEPDLKVEEPLLKQFQTLGTDSSLRLVSRAPDQLSRYFAALFPPELVNAAQLLGLAITFGSPTKGHMVLTTADAAGAQQLAAQIGKASDHWLALPDSDFILCKDPPKVDQNDKVVDLLFDVPDGSARLLLQRLARVQPVTSAPQ